MIKNIKALIAAAIMVFLCVAAFPITINLQPNATKIALNTMKNVLIVGNKGIIQNSFP
ncbi:hypothetical protein OPHB3_2764 [Oceanobacillus picturae]|uniref:Uncharacterized protein n=1 Tax=Oceanobacillus picturae TaxID=171693 RepID=A0A0U9HEZ4_9BACI|nr:hypothetical protein OPHB3_2764 [Oceanobacillus picturae]